MLSKEEFYERIRQSAMMPDEEQEQRWKDYSGYYSFSKWGQVIFTVHVQSEDNLVFNGYPVVEVEPGLFIAFDGEAIDFRGETLIVSSNSLERDSGILQAQNILLRLCGIGFILAILWNLAEFVSRIIQRRKGKVKPHPQLRWLEVFTQIAITLGSLFAVATISTFNKFQILLFSGTPLPQRGIPFDMQFGFSVVYAAVILALLSVVGLVQTWRAGLGSRLNRIFSSVFTGFLVLYGLLVVM
jgi:hypothetical protein